MNFLKNIITYEIKQIRFQRNFEKIQLHQMYTNFHII